MERRTTTVARSPLTERQRAILDFIRASIETEGWQPTIRDIGERFGIRSTNGVNDHLRALEIKGWIEKRGGGRAGIRITDGAAVVIAGRSAA